MNRWPPLSRRRLVQLAALPLLPACRNPSEDPPMPSTTHTTEAPAGAHAPPDAASYRLDERASGGRRLAQTTLLGSDGRPQTVDVHEWTSWLRVRSDERTAVLVQTRREGDLVGQGVGCYRRTLDDAMLATLQHAIETLPWTKLPTPTGGDIRANHYAIDYQRGGLLIQRGFNARNFEFMAAIAPYMDAASEIMNYLGERPLGLVKSSLWVRELGSDRSARQLGLVLENPGAGPVAITDPRVPPAPGEAPRAVLKVAPAGNGWSEPSWTLLALPALPAGAPKTLVLPAGGKLELAVEWRASGPGTHWLNGEWFDYGGPIEPPADALPFMPLAALGPTPSADGPYCVRGAAFAEGVIFEVS
jgi:hypothetical protein